MSHSFTGFCALGYPIYFFRVNSVNPADSNIYYMGHSLGLTSTQGAYRAYIPSAGTIRKIYGNFYQTPGTNEASTLSLLKNGATEVLISNTLDHSGSITAFSKTDLSLGVAAGDYLELKWVTPAWVTNPTGQLAQATVWVEP